MTIQPVFNIEDVKRPWRRLSEVWDSYVENTFESFANHNRKQHGIFVDKDFSDNSPRALFHHSGQQRADMCSVIEQWIDALDRSNFPEDAHFIAYKNNKPEQLTYKDFRLHLTDLKKRINANLDLSIIETKRHYGRYPDGQYQGTSQNTRDEAYISRVFKKAHDVATALDDTLATLAYAAEAMQHYVDQACIEPNQRWTHRARHNTETIGKAGVQSPQRLRSTPVS
jgi:hypothetical protein